MFAFAVGYIYVQWLSLEQGRCLLAARTLLVAPGITSSNKKLLGTKGS